MEPKSWHDDRHTFENGARWKETAKRDIKSTIDFRHRFFFHMCFLFKSHTINIERGMKREEKKDTHDK